MFFSNRYRLKSRLGIAALVLAGLWVGPAQAMNVTLTATPAASVCQNGNVSLVATATNLPAGTASVKYHFTINRVSDNSFEENWAWSLNASQTWTPQAGAATRSPFNLWVVAEAFGINGQHLAATPASINGYQVHACAALAVRLFPKPETSVRVHCQVTLYATAEPHTPPAGQHYEYRFYVQDSNYITVPNACPPQSTARLCNWRPTHIGQFRVGVQAYRMTSGNPPLEVATTEFAPYAVQATGACP